MKMLALTMGINAANSGCPCPHCTCPVEKFHDTTKVWSLTDLTFGARLHENALPSIGINGQINEPIISFIPFSNFVPDLLHMNLRISENLFEHVFDDLVKMDWSLTPKTKMRQNTFLNYLSLNVGISNPIFLAKKKICLRSFSRDENLKILSKMPLTTLFKDLTKVAKIEKSWRDFYEICMALMQNEWTPEKIKEKTKTWLKTLCKEIYYDAIATLYMHELQAHMHQFVELHGDVNKFNCQLLEKRNHSNSKNLFQSTNLHTNLSEKDDCLVQLLNKNNRTDYLNRFDEPEVKKRVISNKRKSNFIENFGAKKTF